VKASTQALKDVIALLPLVLAKRYDPNVFGVAAANKILSEVEQSCDPDFFTEESGLVLLSGVTDYELPNTVRQIRGLYQVQAGDVVTDRDHPVSHSMLNNRIRLSDLPDMSSTADIVGTVPSGAPSDKTKVYDNAKLGSAVAANALLSRLIRVTHASGVVEYKILKGNTPSSFTADINGSLTTLAAVGDTYLITANFLIIEHTRYLNRLTPGSTTGIIDLPQDFEGLFHAGMFFRYHAQADNLSTETKFWQEEYARLTNSFMVDTTKVRGTNIQNSPRPIPSLFK
jgi:hypothetical protein